MLRHIETQVVTEPSYIIWRDAGRVYAKNGKTGHIEFSGTDASTVIRAAVNALTGGGKISFRNGLYLMSSPIDVTVENITFEGNGWGTELRANASMAYMFNVGNTRYAKFKNLFLNGYGLAAKCIDGSSAVSSSKIHEVHNCKVWGATSACIDFSGCEDSSIIDTWVDGRRDTSEPPTLYCDYGIYFGTISATGMVELRGIKSMFFKKADIYAKGVSKLNIINSVLTSKGSYSASYQANLVLDATGMTEVIQTWMENDNSLPNIYVYNSSEILSIISCFLTTGEGQNIKAATGKSLDILSILGGRIARGGTGTHIAVPCNGELIVLNTDLYGGNLASDLRIDMTNVARYWYSHAGLIRSNIWRAGTATITSGQTSVTAPHGLGATPSVVVVTPRANIGSVWVSARDTNNITINCSTAPASDTMVDFIAILI